MSETTSPAPAWRVRARLTDLDDQVMLDWLFNEDSLTRRLTRLSSGGFSVTPLNEGWQPLRDEECTVLGVPLGSEGWVREVYLRGNGTAWVFARSVAARSALEDSGLGLDVLGSRSLGELLFSDTAFQRGELQVCHYPAAWLPEESASADFWGRRSCFARGPLKVLVAEVFLPAVWSAIADCNPAAEPC